MLSATTGYKKKEDLEDCSCSSNSAEQYQKQQQQQSQLSNKFDNSENYKKKSTAGVATKEEHQEETEIDSGFMSGPQSGYISDKFDDSIEQKFADHKNIPTNSSQNINIPEEKETILDSGFIAEDFNEDDVIHTSEVSTSGTAKLSQSKKPSAPVRSATVESAPAISIVANEIEEQMRFKHNVDSGMSERFCALSLQTSEPGQGITINNLNAPRRRSASTPVADEYQQFLKAQQQKQNDEENNKKTSTTKIISINAWEEFFKQDSEGDTPLHMACITGSNDVVAALIRIAVHPCLFNIQNDDGQTPLHLAALTSQPKILRMLLIAGAEPSIRNCHGNTALHLACISGEEQCVSALTIPISASEIQEAHRQYGHRSTDRKLSYVSSARLPSDMEIRNYDGERCVHIAAQSGHVGILRILHLYGADINAREGRSGYTPLHIAIETCNEDVANFLLDECQKDINLETATYAGLTAYQFACILHRQQFINILQNHGAEPLTPPESDYDSSSDGEELDESMMFGDPGYFVNYNSGNTMTVA